MHARQIIERIGVFIAISAEIEVLAIAPRLEQRRERGKRFVTGSVFGGVSRLVQEIDHSGDGTRGWWLGATLARLRTVSR
jgi:hypothetical protein